MLNSVFHPSRNAPAAVGATVVASELTKHYGSTEALTIDGLTLAPGEAVGLVGNNGAGKTTLLRLALDLIRPTTGAVSIDGHVVAEGEGWKPRVGAYLDSGFLIDYLKPREYFRLIGGAYGMTADETVQRATAYESFLGPTVTQNDALLRDLSLGNAGKVGIVGAMLPQPGLVVLDEPFANLDPGARIQLQDLLRAERARGATVLVSSHDLDHVVDVCSRVLVLAAGRVVRDTPSTPGTLAELRSFFAQGGIAA